jgi:peptide deformylase
VTVRPLRLLGDPVLRTACDEVLRFDAALDRLVQDLLDTVRVPGRAGLAANQIGSSLAVFSYNVDGQFGYVINPVITETAGDQKFFAFPMNAGHKAVRWAAYNSAGGLVTSSTLIPAG